MSLANHEVQQELTKDKNPKKRGPYTKVSISDMFLYNQNCTHTSFTYGKNSYIFAGIVLESMQK